MGNSNCWLTTGAVVAALAVAAGAFAAHGLDNYFHRVYAGKFFEKKVNGDGRETVISQIPLAEKYLADFKTGAAYQMYHGLALLAVGLFAQHRPSRGLSIAGFCFLLGCLGFCGGLYAYSLTGVKWLAMFVVPAGGVLFLAGWTMFAIAACPGRKAV